MNQFSAPNHFVRNSGSAPRRKSSGRPKSLSPRNKNFVIRASDAEAVVIRAAAADAQLPTAIYLRRRALNQIVTAPLPVSDVQTASSLAAIGENLNQAIKLAHEGRTPDWPAAQIEELRTLCVGISDKIVMSANRR